METQASAAVEELHRLHSKNVHRYVYRRLLDIEASRQIANDAFRLAWQRGISPGADALPWLLVAARNLVGNELHSMGREKNLVFKAAAAQLSERGGRDSGLDDQVHEVLDALRAKDREVLILAYWDALSIAEIAAVLECSHESAKSRLFRARNAVDRKAPTSMLKGGGSNGQHSEAHFRHRSGRTRQHRRSRSAATPRPRPGLQPAAGTGQSGKFPGQMADPRGRNSHRRSGRRTRYLGSMAGPTGTVPAAPTLPTTENPTNGPYPSSSVDGSALPRIDYGLPNFLVPANQDVYFEDSPSCNTLDLRTLDLVDANGIRTKLPDNANAYPVVGCVDSLAAILRSDLAEAGNPTGNGSGIWLARWQDGSWSIKADDDTGINVVHGMPLFTNPRLRALDNPSDPILKTEQLRQLKVLGLDDTGMGRLLGPDVPSWMGAKAMEERHAFGNELLRTDHPAWEEREWKMDGNGTPIDDPTIGPNDVDRYDLLL